MAVALANTSAEPDRELYELARSVDGWGRIELVQRLSGTQDPEIQDWIFHTGFRNAVMNEYLAHIAATTGNLVGRLRDDPDDETLDAACDIVSALVVGGPAEDIDDYEDAAEVVMALLEILENRATRLSHFLVVDDIEHFLDHEEGWDQRADNGWTPDIRSTAKTTCQRIKSGEYWHELARSQLDSDDEVLFYEAERTARALGHDTFAAHWSRVKADPLGASWWNLMQQADANRIRDVIDLAIESLPLEDIASGPGTALGVGPEWQPHMALDFVVQDLGHYPGVGWELVSAALRSPMVRNRNMAINTLSAWGHDQWPDDAIGAVQTALANEPLDDVRARMRGLLAREPLDEVE